MARNHRPQFQYRSSILSNNQINFKLRFSLSSFTVNDCEEKDYVNDTTLMKMAGC